MVQQIEVCLQLPVKHHTKFSYGKIDAFPASGVCWQFKSPVTLQLGCKQIWRWMKIMKDTFGRSVVGHSFSPITMSCLCFQTFHTPELSNFEIFGIRQLQLKFWSYQPLIQVHQFRTLPAQTIERSGPRDTDAADAEDGRAGDFHAILSYLSIAVLFLLPSLPFLPFLPCPALAKRHLHVVYE